MTGRAQKDDAGRSQRENFKLLQERLDLSSRVASLESMNDGLREELEQTKSSLSQERSDKQTQNQLIEMSKRSEQKHKFNAGKWQREVMKSESTIAKAESDLKSARDELEAKKVRLAALEAEAAVSERMRTDRANQEAGYGRLQSHLMELSRDAAQKQHHLQNQLHATRQFLEQLKIEYEEYSATARLEHELFRRSKQAEYQKLKEEFDQYRSNQYEANQSVLRHQHELVHALQQQFTEYRSTAESLFESEARSLDDRLKSIHDRHTTEIRLLVKSKEQQFQSMVSSKDAKIMHLIEGTDYQKVLVRHHTELAQLRDQHEIELKKTKEIVELETKRQISDLKKLVSEKMLQIDKLNSQCIHWKKLHEELIAKIAKLTEQHRIKEKSSHDTNERLGEELNQKTEYV